MQACHFKAEACFVRILGVIPTDLAGEHLCYTPPQALPALPLSFPPSKFAMLNSKLFL